MCKYLELKKANQKMFDEFAKDKIYWIIAFSDSEVERLLKLNNLKRDEIVSIGGGGVIKKEDVKAFHELYNNMHNEIEMIKNDPDELKKAFIYELANHEYCISYDIDDTLNALGITRKNLQDDINMALIMNDAIKTYLSNPDNY